MLKHYRGEKSSYKILFLLRRLINIKSRNFSLIKRDWDPK